MSGSGVGQTPLERTAIPEAYERAWQLRREHFGETVRFHAPSQKRYETSEFAAGHDDFLALSTTGDRCGLDCDHCQGTVLERMHPVEDGDHLSRLSESLSDRDAEGFLLSGGCDAQGRVHLDRYLDGIREADRRGLDVALHTGLVEDPAVAARYAEAGAEAAMVDIIGDERTIESVYGLEKKPANYERTLAVLADTDLKLIPHVVIGLHYGEIRGEWAALEMIRRYDVHALVLVVLTPKAGVPMGGVEPPSTEAVGDVCRQAREMLPETSIQLGCARPKGREYSLEVETKALKAGLNGIAYPSEGVIDFAERLGLDPVLNNRCCSL